MNKQEADKKQIESNESMESSFLLMVLLAIAQFIGIFFLADGSATVILTLILGMLLIFLLSEHTNKAIGVIARGLIIIFKDNSRLRDLASLAEDRNSALLGIFTIIVFVLLISVLTTPERFAELLTLIRQLLF